MRSTHPLVPNRLLWEMGTDSSTASMRGADRALELVVEPVLRKLQCQCQQVQQLAPELRTRGEVCLRDE